jgi:NAD kinase
VDIFFTSSPEKMDFDLVITIGGDGTILWAHAILNRDVLPPFICFDGGSLCFLSNFRMADMKTVLERISLKLAKNEELPTFTLPRLKV